MTKARSLADFISDGNPLADGIIAVSEVSGAAPLADPSFTGNIAVTGNVDGRDVAADGTKLDGIETSATADQTDAEIRTAVEAATDSNVFTDADHSKLNAIEASATADQSNAEIRAAVEAATDSNVFTDADHTKLNAIEASADVTDTVNVVAALTAGSNITIASDGTIAGAAQYTHPTHAGDDASVDTGALSGATVISDLDFNITTDTLGHVTDANATVATRNLTLANLGYTGATDATNNTVANAALPKAGGSVTGNVTFGDSNKIVMGAGSDLELYHDGGNSFVDEVGNGKLYIRASDGIVLSTPSNALYLSTYDTGNVSLYHNGVKKFDTTSSGIDVTGTVNADALTGIGSIDATTAAAIGAAGVGGAMSLISTTTFSSTTLVTLTLPTGYNFLRVEFFDVLGGGASTSNISYVNLYLSDSSGTARHGSSDYRANMWNGSLSFGDNFTGAFQIRCANNYKTRFHIDITGAYDASVPTMASGYGSHQDATSDPTNFFGYRRANEVNRDLIVGDNGNFGFTSGTYNVWGIK